MQTFRAEEAFIQRFGRGQHGVIVRGQRLAVIDLAGALGGNSDRARVDGQVAVHQMHGKLIGDIVALRVLDDCIALKPQLARAGIGNISIGLSRNEGDAFHLVGDAFDGEFHARVFKFKLIRGVFHTGVNLRVILGFDGDLELLVARLNRQRAQFLRDDVVVQIRAEVRRIGEGVGARARQRLRAEDVILYALAVDKAVSGLRDLILGQRLAVVGLGFRRGGQRHVALGDLKRAVSRRDVVVVRVRVVSQFPGEGVFAAADLRLRAGVDAGHALVLDEAVARHLDIALDQLAAVVHLLCRLGGDRHVALGDRKLAVVDCGDDVISGSVRRADDLAVHLKERDVVCADVLSGCGCGNAGERDASLRAGVAAQGLVLAVILLAVGDRGQRDILVPLRRVGLVAGNGVRHRRRPALERVALFARRRAVKGRGRRVHEGGVGLRGKRAVRALLIGDRVRTMIIEGERFRLCLVIDRLRLRVSVLDEERIGVAVLEIGRRRGMIDSRVVQMTFIVFGMQGVVRVRIDILDRVHGRNILNVHRAVKVPSIRTTRCFAEVVRCTIRNRKAAIDAGPADIVDVDRLVERIAFNGAVSAARNLCRRDGAVIKAALIARVSVSARGRQIRNISDDADGIPAVAVQLQSGRVAGDLRVNIHVIPGRNRRRLLGITGDAQYALSHGVDRHDVDEHQRRHQYG